MENRELSFEDRKIVQLNMLIEIDKFCRDNNIKYALSCGTLIGAVRHNGFIPWDDDVDITMPYEEMIRFKTKFKSETMVYCDINTTSGYEFPFARIANTKTYSKKGLIARDYGVCIDLYPIIECSSDKSVLNFKLSECNQLFKYYVQALNWHRRLLKYLPLPSINYPLYSYITKKYASFFIDKIMEKGGGSFYQIGGPLPIFFKNYWSFDPFESLIEVQFEGHRFFSPARYNEFLTVRYGNFMKLPPENQRHPYHMFHYYWK